VPTAESYRVFGGVLRSELPIADLEPLADRPEPDWVVLVGSGEPEAFDGVRVGQEEVTSEASVELFSAPGRFRLVFTDTGVFDFFDEGRRIVWHGLPDSDPEAAAVDVLGRCLAVSFHQEGSLCLHGSAVAFDEGSVAFLAPKHHGKSTTALALTRSGARLLSDDALPVRLTDPPMAYPGVHAVRLWEDSAEQVADGQRSRVGLGGKLVVDRMDAHMVMHEPTPLAAVYLLVPVVAEEGTPAAQRFAMNSLESSLALVGQAKIGGLLGGVEAPVTLDRSLQLAESVPVYRLAIVRDFDRLDEVVETLRSWHADLIQEGT